MQVRAIVLAGGGAQRLGGAAKPYLSVAGQPLISRVLAACSGAGAAALVVVGPPPPPSLGEQIGGADVQWTREEPAGRGPAPAVAAGLRALGPDPRDLVLLLAADAPRIDEALSAVVAAATESVLTGGVGAWAVAAGVRQPLLSCVRADALAKLDLDAGGSLFSALAALGLAEVRVDERAIADADTWDDLIDLRREAAVSDGISGSDQQRLQQWVRAAAEAAEVPAEAVDIDAVLDLAREAAHNVQRPAAPVTTFLLGYAAAARDLDESAVAALADRLASLAKSQAPES